VGYGRFVTVGRGSVLQGMVRSGRYVEEGSGKVRFSKAGMAWSGEVRCGSLQQGRYG